MLTKNLDDQGLIELLGLENAPIEAQTEGIETATEVIETKVLDRILDKLDDAETTTFMGLLESKDEDGGEMEKFLTEKNLDLLEIMKEEIAGFKADIMKTVMGTEKPS